MRIWFPAIAFLFLSAAPASAQTPGLTIDKQRVAFMSRKFDPARPPADMPPLSFGEEAECDSNFLSNARVGGEARQTDATHATVTITQVNVTLRLVITMWLPDRVSGHVAEHEAGHRRISEYFYENADRLAERIAAPYMGRQIDIGGANLTREFHQALQKISAAITDEYTRELKPEPAQLRFDALTDHARNTVPALDAVAQVLQEMPRPPVESPDYLGR